VPDDYAKIQWAVDNATTGDTIIVRDGIYYENVVLNKTLSLIGNGMPIIDAQCSGSAITITADNCAVKGFRCINASRDSPYFDAGIKVASIGNIIENNTCEKNYNGICLYSSNNTVINNKICKNDEHGIYLGYSSNNTILNNICEKNWDGICLSDSSNNTIKSNVCKNNDCGIQLWMNSSGNIISNNTCEDNNVGGIFLDDSSNNTIAKNSISKNNHYGIRLYSSSNNKIYLNNLLENPYNVDSLDSTNIWNSTSKITYTCNGSTYTNYLGNYWSDYTGGDADGDGIGDTPYVIDGDADNYPLMLPWENYFQPTPTPPAKTLVVNQTDACTTGDLYFSTISDAVMNASAGDTIIVCPGTYYENVDVDYLDHNP